VGPKNWMVGTYLSNQESGVISAYPFTNSTSGYLSLVAWHDDYIYLSYELFLSNNNVDSIDFSAKQKKVTHVIEQYTRSMTNYD